MLQLFGQDWRNLPLSDMLDAAEMLMVDEIERQCLASFDEKTHGGRTTAREQVKQALYQQFVSTASRDEVAKTWGLTPEHAAGLSAAMSMARSTG